MTQIPQNAEIRTKRNNFDPYKFNLLIENIIKK